MAQFFGRLQTKFWAIKAKPAKVTTAIPKPIIGFFHKAPLVFFV
jgi:hypothetical protein